MLWFWNFVVYSFAGFLLEVAFAKLTGGRAGRKGLLVLPLCPVYGAGACLILALPRWADSRPWVLFLLGGLAATRDLDCVTVDYLFVAEGARGQGLGAALLDRAEDEARRRGARRMLLNTFSFQAPGFYDRQGYRRFGGVSPCLGEYGQYFYVKELQNNPPQSPGQG